MKKRFFTISILIIIFVLSLTLVACNDNNDVSGGRVPVYQGMTISQDLSMATAPRFSSNGGGSHHGGNKKPGDYHGDHTGRNDDLDQDLPFDDENLPTIEEKVEITLDVIGSADKIYYADKNQDIYITIKLSNPDSYEIMSFTLNGNKYSSYMFEQGSDMENLILKLNVGNGAGIVDYTIDAIKYIDGTDIKDVVMDGDKTVKAGIRASDQTYANVTNESVSLSEINFTANIVDLYHLIEKSGGYAKAVLYSGADIKYKDIAVGKEVSVTFDNLTPNTLYQYAVLAYYDNLSGTGAELNILYKNAVYTNTIVLFDNINVGKTSASWDYIWDNDANNKTITALSLWQNGNKIKDLSADAKTVGGLYTDNEYTIKAEYNNLKGSSETIGFSFITLTNAIPTMSISNVSTTQASVGFGIDITDNDNLGAITKIELLHGNDEPILAENNTIREFDSLLSNNDYTIRVTYTYNLNDGVGEQTIVKTMDCKTQAKAVPTVSIIDVSTTQASVGFDIDITDNDNVGAITKIELLHGNDEPILAENNTIREFDSLLSNNDYTIRVTYTYNLNDGVGEQTIVKTMDCKTQAKAVPTVSIIDVSTTQASVGFDIDITDNDNVGAITKIELLHGNDEPILAENNTIREFDSLLSNNDYTIRVTYTYNLNDGVGDRDKYATYNCWTAPIFEFVEAVCANTGPVSEGETIYFEAIVNNPNKVVVSKVKLNGEYYNVSAGTTQNSIIVNILVVNQFEGGNTELTITEIIGTLNGIERNIIIDNTANATATAFVNGELTVKYITIVDEYGEVPELLEAGGLYYYYIKLGNKTGYSIDKITVSGATYNKGDSKINQIDDETILIATTYGVGWRSNTLTSIEYSNESLGTRTREFGESTAEFLCLESLSPIIISNANDLKNMNSYGYYVLESDIDLSGTDTEWKNPGGFNGYFDGQGHIIKNMNFVNTVENNNFYWGLFNNATGVITNLRISGRLIATITSTTSDGYRVYAGGLVAQSSGRLIIDKVASNVTLAITQQTSEQTYIGGLVGYAGSSISIIIKNSYSTGNISTTRGSAGGMIGYKDYYWNGGDVAVCYDSYFISPTANASYGAVYKNNIGEIIAILQPIWGDVVWDFDELDSNGNPTYKERYSISYELNGGTNSRQNPVQYTSHSANIVIYQPERFGYTFEGWYYNAQFEGVHVEAILAGEFGNRTLYAKWSNITATITLDTNGGLENFGTIVLTTEDTISLPIPTHTDKTLTFFGWYTDKDAGARITFGNGEGLESWACDDSEITLYARWYSYHRVNANNDPTANGDYILFGEYPQTIKANDVTITETTDGRGYYLGSDGYYYAKVTATPCTYPSGYRFSTNATISSGIVYYFKVEPIKWRILSESGGTALILCESIIANKRYNEYNTGTKNGVYANNYKESEIRAWLNNEFYNTAFNTLQQELIQITNVDNSVYSTGYSSNPSTCANTNDKIFLPSYREMVNTAYGFSSDYNAYDTARRRLTSDYSRATGVLMSTGTTYYGTGWWWLRSPSSKISDYARNVGSDGYAGSNDGYADYNVKVNNTGCGVVPALVISLP